MKPDYEKAAIKATETLIKHRIDSAPVSPLPMLKRTPNVLAVSYEMVSTNIGDDRSCVMSMFGEHNQDAFTTVNTNNGHLQYIVTYNQRLPFYLLQRALARELGHIVLGHDGSLPEDIRNEEAKTFAHHLLCPRPLIHAVKAIGLRLTEEVLNNLTGCNTSCLSCMRKIPFVNVPVELNRIVRDNFMPYIVNFYNYQIIASRNDGSALADIGSYMEGYIE